MNSTIQQKSIYTEVLSVLLALDHKYMAKIPENVLEQIINNSNIKNLPFIDKNKRIEEQNISKEARAFLTMLKLKYWCKSKKEKDILIKALEENEKKYQEKLQEKFDSETLFKDKVIEKNTEVAVIEEKENLFKKIISKIKNIIKIR